MFMNKVFAFVLIIFNIIFSSAMIQNQRGEEDFVDVYNSTSLVVEEKTQSLEVVSIYDDNIDTTTYTLVPVNEMQSIIIGVGAALLGAAFVVILILVAYILKSKRKKAYEEYGYFGEDGQFYYYDGYYADDGQFYYYDGYYADDGQFYYYDGYYADDGEFYYYDGYYDEYGEFHYYDGYYADDGQFYYYDELDDYDDGYYGIDFYDEEYYDEYYNSDEYYDEEYSDSGIATFEPEPIEPIKEETQESTFVSKERPTIVLKEEVRNNNFSSIKNIDKPSTTSTSKDKGASTKKAEQKESISNNKTKSTQSDKVQKTQPTVKVKYSESAKKKNQYLEDPVAESKIKKDSKQKTSAKSNAKIQKDTIKTNTPYKNTISEKSDKPKVTFITSNYVFDKQIRSRKTTATDELINQLFIDNLRVEDFYSSKDDDYF